MELFHVHEVRAMVAGLDHPEGVNFGPDGAGYAGGEAGQLYRFTADGHKDIVANTGGGIGGLCVDGHHNVYECNYDKPYVHRISPGRSIFRQTGPPAIGNGSLSTSPAITCAVC